MASVSTYLIFSRNTEEAFNFYSKLTLPDCCWHVTGPNNSREQQR
ncbi:MAG TPA: hypothetical protein PL085_03475 [Agriterribacter sp.]|nr:hypothetical protein [Agriterribacter sp.]